MSRAVWGEETAIFPLYSRQHSALQTAAAVGLQLAPQFPHLEKGSFYPPDRIVLVSGSKCCIHMWCLIVTALSREVMTVGISLFFVSTPRPRAPSLQQDWGAFLPEAGAALSAGPGPVTQPRGSSSDFSGPHPGTVNTQ